MTLVLTLTVNFRLLTTLCSLPNHSLFLIFPFSSPHTFNHLPLFPIHTQHSPFGFPLSYFYTSLPILILFSIPQLNNVIKYNTRLITRDQILVNQRYK